MGTETSFDVVKILNRQCHEAGLRGSKGIISTISRAHTGGTTA